MVVSQKAYEFLTLRVLDFFESSYSSPLRSICACLTGGFRVLDFFESLTCLLMTSHRKVF